MAHILVIDDDPEVRRALEAALRRDHTVAVAENGRAAIARFGESEPDVVITDLFMPDMDGFETIAALRRLRPGIQLIVMSGGGLAGRIDVLEIARSLNVAATLAKPFRRADLLDAVRAALGGCAGAAAL